MAGCGELVVVRHGQSVWNDEHRFTGQADPPLSGLGRRQAHDLARRCRGMGLGKVACSDLARAEETASIVAADLGLSSPVTHADLRERWSDTLTGMTRDDIERRFPGQLAAWRAAEPVAIPGPYEAFADFSARVVRGLAEVAESSAPTLVVAHAGVFVVLAAVAGRVGGEVANAEGCRVTVENRRIAAVGAPVPPVGEGLLSGRADP